MVLVEWNDHAFHSGEYEGPEDALCIFRTVGWMMPDSDAHILRIAQSVDQFGRFHDVLALDTRVVTTKVVLATKGAQRGTPKPRKASTPKSSAPQSVSRRRKPKDGAPEQGRLL